MIRLTIWFLILPPLTGFILNGVLGRKIIRRASYPLSMAMVFISFVSSCILLGYTVRHDRLEYTLFRWIESGALQVGFTVLIDRLSTIMLVVVTFVGFLIHIYSGAYMQNDNGFHRYFAFLNLFIFSMLMLIISNNYLMMYVFWEAVGLCSYLLIGFWYEKKSATNAAKKAFIVNRIGDAGFALGIFLLFLSARTLQFSEVFITVQALPEITVTIITLLLFLGACGKSAQFPLHIWLPDAMEGPTPVSALIHAATMVTAGVYMIARSSPLYAMAPVTLETIAVIGAFTAFIAATMALVQTDLKKILAYSTISQLGYMFLALGVGAVTSAIFHLATHAFFKALLFLCAGSVMHAAEGNIDITKLGGLRKKMPVTHWTFIVGGLSLAGIPPLAGFFSKDDILSHVFSQRSYILWGAGLLTAFLTSLYIMKAYFLTFTGKFRGPESVYEHCHESPRRMKIPLVILAVFTCIIGFAGLPAGDSLFHNFLIQNTSIDTTFSEIPHLLEILLICISVIVSVAGVIVAYLFFYRETFSALKLSARFSYMYKTFYYLYGMEWVAKKVVASTVRLAKFLSEKFDELFIDRMVDGAAGRILNLGEIIRRFHSGRISDYVAMMTIATMSGTLYFIWKVFY